MASQLNGAELDDIFTLLRVGPFASSHFYGAVTPSESKVAARLVQRQALGTLPAAAGLIDALRPWKEYKCADWVVERGSGGARAFPRLSHDHGDARLRSEAPGVCLLCHRCECYIVTPAALGAHSRQMCNVA